MIEEHHLAPRFTVDVIMDVFNLATLPADRLGAPVASLAGEPFRAKIIRVIDELISQA